VWWEGVYLGDVLEYKDKGVRLCRCLWELEAGKGCVDKGVRLCRCLWELSADGL